MKSKEIQFGQPYMYDRYPSFQSTDGTAAVWVLTKDTYREANPYERRSRDVDFVRHLRGEAKGQFTACGLLCITYNTREDGIPEHVAEVLSKITFAQVENAGMKIPALYLHELGDDANRVDVIVAQQSKLTGPSWEAVREERLEHQRQNQAHREENLRQEVADQVRAKKLGRALMEMNGDAGSYRWITVNRGSVQVDLDDLEELLKRAGYDV